MILVTGATGYVGGRLVPRLLDAGRAVRVLVRDVARLEGRPWRSRVDVVEGDVLRPETLAAAMSGVTAAYYLIHSMSDAAGFAARDVTAARHFAEAARTAGVQQLVYLGGLGDPATDLSRHLRSRQETGDALRASGVGVTEFRAGVIVGSGSVSFEMIRYLTERIPVMICPRWVFTRAQPIGIRDVLEYLVAALTEPRARGRVIEIGGTDILTYGEMMLGYGRARGLRRVLVPVPVLTPNLSAYWVHWMTPIPAGIAHPLIEGLRNEVVVRSPGAAQAFPGIVPEGYGAAVRRALAQVEAGQVETSWSDALAGTQGDDRPVTLAEREGFFVERRQRAVAAAPEVVYGVVAGVGGARGWPYADWAWRLRGALDRLVGGVGLRRGRRHPDALHPGDALDFWRVERADAPRLLRLRAEMKVPGEAWLQFDVQPTAVGARLTQTAFFAPRGLPGLAYWYGLYPAHRVIFSGMVRRLGELSEAAARKAR